MADSKVGAGKIQDESEAPCSTRKAWVYVKATEVAM